MWKDVTSYSQGDRDRRPTCWSVRVGGMRISLVWDHRYCPGVWSTSLYGVYENRELGIGGYGEIELAKESALRLAEGVIGEVLAGIQGELRGKN